MCGNPQGQLEPVKETCAIRRVRERVLVYFNVFAFLCSTAKQKGCLRKEKKWLEVKLGITVLNKY